MEENVKRSCVPYILQKEARTNQTKKEIEREKRSNE